MESPRAFTAVVNPTAGGSAAAATLIPLARLLREAGAEVAVEHSRGLTLSLYSLTCDDGTDPRFGADVWVDLRGHYGPPDRFDYVPLSGPWGPSVEASWEGDCSPFWGDS